MTNIPPNVSSLRDGFRNQTPDSQATLIVAKDDMTPVEFTGDGGAFFGLCSRGALMELVTFGFYRFWLATNIRRQLWTATLIGDERLEYMGRGRELLIGFLFALAIILPLNFMYFLIGVEAERARAFASFPLLLFYLVFGQFALYRARRYRLTRTIYRGVRFWMSGSGWVYAFRWLGWSIVVLLTLGLAFPWMATSLERYKMRNTYYGDLRGGFDGRARTLFRSGFKYWLLCGAPVLAVVVSLLVQLAMGKFSRAFPYLGLLLIPMPLIVFFVWPFFRALGWRWWAEGAHFGELRLASDVRGGSLLKLNLKAIFSVLPVFIGGLIVFGIVIAIIVSIVGVDFKSLPKTNPIAGFHAGHWMVIGSGALGYLITLLAVGVVLRYFLTFRFWGIVTSSLRISRLDTIEGVTARGEAANALGEGLADGFDIAGF